MLEINEYHENIVNLQGITCQVSAIEDDVVNVRKFDIVWNMTTAWENV